MSLRSWSRSNADYGRKMLNSGLDGARSGREVFLNGKPLTPFLSESARSALTPAVIGACIGALGSYPNHRHNQYSISRVFAYGFLGGAIGFSAGIAWESRRLTASVAAGALRNMEKVSDEHWLEKHPIDYA
jgi:hypothetical protein